MERQPVRQEPLELRVRPSQASKRVPRERSELLEQLERLELLEQQDKLDKLLVERLVQLLPEQRQLKLALEVSELELSGQELSPDREDQQYLEHRPLLPERSVHPVLELPVSSDRPPTPLLLDSSVRTPIPQRPVPPDKRLPAEPEQIRSHLRIGLRQGLERHRISPAEPEESRPRAPSQEPPRPRPQASLPFPRHLYPSPILIPILFQLFLEILIPL